MICQTNKNESAQISHHLVIIAKPSVLLKGLRYYFRRWWLAGSQFGKADRFTGPQKSVSVYSKFRWFSHSTLLSDSLFPTDKRKLLHWFVLPIEKNSTFTLQDMDILDLLPPQYICYCMTFVLVRTEMNVLKHQIHIQLYSYTVKTKKENRKKKLLLYFVGCTLASHHRHDVTCVWLLTLMDGYTITKLKECVRPTDAFASY